MGSPTPRESVASEVAIFPWLQAVASIEKFFKSAEAAIARYPNSYFTQTHKRNLRELGKFFGFGREVEHNRNPVNIDHDSREKIFSLLDDFEFWGISTQESERVDRELPREIKTAISDLKRALIQASAASMYVHRSTRQNHNEEELALTRNNIREEFEEKTKKIAPKKTVAKSREGKKPFLVLLDEDIAERLKNKSKAYCIPVQHVMAMLAIEFAVAEPSLEEAKSLFERYQKRQITARLERLANTPLMR